MSTVYTRRLIGPRFLPSASSSIFEVPAGKTAILRNFVLINSHPTAAGLIVLGVDGTGFSARILRTSIAAVSAQFFDIRVPLIAGEDVFCTCDLPSHVALTVAGYLFNDP